MGPLSRQVRRPHARLPILALPPAARRGAANASRRRDANASRSPAGARPTSRSPRASRGPSRSTPASGTSSAASTTRSAGPTARALRGPSTTGASRRGTTPAALRQTYPSDGEKKKKKKQARRPARKGEAPTSASPKIPEDVGVEARGLNQSLQCKQCCRPRPQRCRRRPRPPIAHRCAQSTRHRRFTSNQRKPVASIRHHARTHRRSRAGRRSGECPHPQPAASLQTRGAGDRPQQPARSPLRRQVRRQGRGLGRHDQGARGRDPRAEPLPQRAVALLPRGPGDEGQALRPQRGQARHVRGRAGVARRHLRGRGVFSTPARRRRARL